MIYKQKNLSGRIAQFLFLACMCIGIGAGTLSASINTPLAVIDSNGNEIAIWVDDNGAGDSSIMAANKPSGGSWSTPQEISIDNTDTHQLSSNGPKLITSADGSRVVAVWTFVDITDGILALSAAQFSTNTGWTSANVISTTNQDVSQDFDLGINGTGQVVLLWNANAVDTGASQLWISEPPVGNGAWTSTQIS